MQQLSKFNENERGGELVRSRKVIGIAAFLLVLLFGGGYWIYDGLTGNHIKIESVLTASPQAEEGAEAAVNSENTGAAADTASIDGVWKVNTDSKVYFSVTTSKETVNYQINKVSGSWTVDTKDSAKNVAEGKVDLTSMDSGNSQRDNHVSGTELLDVAQFPEASFKAVSFGGLPSEWKEGTVFPLKIAGELTVKGITKSVTFAGNASYTEGGLKLEASTVVTFGDFGMKSPNTIVMDTENNLTVELRLIFVK